MLTVTAEYQHVFEQVSVGNGSRMRTLLQNCSSGLYFEGPDQWTTNPDKAFNFKSIDHALEFINKWKLKSVEVVFAFRGGHHVQRVPKEKLLARYAEEER
jgi:hypothetical protein